MMYRRVLVYVALCVLTLSSRAFAQEARTADFFGEEETYRRTKAHWDKAVQYVQQSKFDKAVTELVWCLDKGVKQTRPELEGSLTYAAVDFIHAIGSVHPAAIKLLKSRRESIEEAFRKGKGTITKAIELYQTSYKLADWTRVQDLYEELGEKKTKNYQEMQGILFRFIEDSLLDDGEYKLLLRGAGDGPSSLPARMEEFEAFLKQYPNLDPRFVDMGKLNLCRSAARYYRAHLALGEKDDAQTLAEQYLEYHARGAAYVLFMRAAESEGQYTLARKLARAARKALPENEYTEFVEPALLALPENKKDREADKPADGKKSKKSGG